MNTGKESVANSEFGLRIYQRKSSTSKPLPSMMLFSVPMGMGLFPCMATITCRPFFVTSFLMAAGLRH